MILLGEYGILPYMTYGLQLSRKFILVFSHFVRMTTDLRSQGASRATRKPLLLLLFSGELHVR